MTQYAYIQIEVGGIQNFILSTGKLKEMIGASQAVVSLTSALYKETAEALDLQSVDEPQPGTGWVVERLKNAGQLKLILAEADGRRFLSAYSSRALARYPGLPLDGALTGCEWTNDSLKQGERELRRQVGLKRFSRPTPAGLNLLPFTESAPRDGRPAAGREPGEAGGWLSWPSVIREHSSLIDEANRRLKSQYDDTIRKSLARAGLSADKLTLKWCDDFDDLLGGREKGRLGLIHIDGNDLGALFRQILEAAPDGDPAARQALANDISARVESANECGLKAALAGVVARDTSGRARAAKTGEYRVPVRPLVLGGDDLTVFARADLAFDFVSAFVGAFEKASLSGAVEARQPISVGVGLLIMPPGFPFVKAYHLVEGLLASAKKATLNLNGNRPSSLDWLVLTSDVENDVAALRHRLYTVRDGDGEAVSLTAKPLYPRSGQSFENAVEEFLATARAVLEKLPRAHTRAALDACRDGLAVAEEAYVKLKDNLQRGLGGRKGKQLMELDCFEKIFPQSFFQESREEGRKKCTALLDYLELAGLLTADEESDRAM